MIFWKRIEVTWNHVWRSTFQDILMNTGLTIKWLTNIRWTLEIGTGWKPDGISKPGENPLKFPDLLKTWRNVPNLVNCQNLVKTWWIFKTWWKPGDFFVVNTKKCFTGSKFAKSSVLSLLFGENFVFPWWKWIQNVIGPKPGETRWKPSEFSKPGENAVKTWWILKTWCKLGENLVKTWWKLGENLVKT